MIYDLVAQLEEHQDFSSSLGIIKPMGRRFFMVASCDLEACKSANAVLIASNWS